MKHLFRRLSQSGWCRLGVKAGLTIAAFWFVLRGVDFARLADMLRTQDHAMLMGVAAILLLQIVVGAFRWRLILNALSNYDHPIGAVAALKMTYASVFFNACLPGTVGGDVIRVWLAKMVNVSTQLAIHSVIIDRLIALLGLGVIILCTLPVLGTLTGVDTVLVYPAVVVAAVAGVWLLYNIERVLKPFSSTRIVHILMYFISSLRMILVHPGTSVISLTYAVIAHLSYSYAAYLLACSLSIHVTPLQCITLIPPVVLATTLPISMGGWGVREAGMVGMFALVKVPQAAALMLSIQMGLMAILVSLPGSLLWLMYRKQTSHHDALAGSQLMGTGQ